MSLIAIRNLLLPFQSVGNLIAIILVVVLFCIFRLSLGGIDSGTSRPAANAAQVGAAGQAAPITQPRAASGGVAPVRAPAALPLDNPLKETLERQPAKNPNSQQENTNPQKGLGDIEAQLGLR